MTLSLPSRGLRGYGGAILAGVISAAIFAFAASKQGTFFIILNILSGIPLFIVGLGAGTTCVALAASFALAIISTMKTLDLAVYFYGMAYALPAVLITALSLHQYKDKDEKPAFVSEGSIITLLAVYPCLVFIIVSIIGANNEGGILGFTLSALVSGIQQTDGASAEQIKQKLDVINMVARVLPSFIGCGWFLVMLLSMFSAQSSLSQQKWNLRPDFQIQHITVSKFLLFVVIATGLAGWFAPSPYNYYSSNICTMLLVPFFFMGLGVVHAFANSNIFRVWILAAYYIVLAIPSQYTTPEIFGLTTLLGMAELWINLRQRFVANKPKVRS